MLKLVNITKRYETGDTAVEALKGVSIEFRKNEFVSILGQSGCGKTTLLNIIGGLDRYTSGDLIIDGRSTKEYNDHDWDTYRNHSIGFVFQSYNLIPHQTVLANVELALTLSGVSKAERRKRAVAALEKVGLGDQINKKPNQMSGGQMQRVAIARALINDPEILLADEPTGALDSETSVQIMELLKEVAKDRLVIMVTHNPELADEYSTRIVRLLDGEVIGDTDPYTAEEKSAEKAEQTAESKKKKVKKQKGTSMSFITALSLSLNNLLTKKGRTFMTAFAGSIGIIGIALILSLSSGFQAYIDRIQEETLSSYPISITAEQADMSQLLLQMMEKEEERETRPDDKVYANTDMYDMMDAMMNPESKTNNLEKFKEWIEEPDNEIMDYISAIQYGYSAPLEVYVYDLSNGIMPANDYMSLFKDIMGDSTINMMGGMMNSGNAVSVFQEILQSKDGGSINELMYEQYELVDDNMKWPENKNEIVLVVDENNEISETFLFTLGLLDRSNIADIMADMASGKGENDLNSDKTWEYSDLVGMKYRLILPTDKYYGVDTDQDGVNDRWIDISESEEQMKLVLGAAEELEIVGIIRPKEDVVASAMTGAVGYLPSLTKWYVEEIGESEMVRYQMEHPEIDVLTGLPFKTADYVEPTEAEKAVMFKEWVAGLTNEEKIKTFGEIFCMPNEDETVAYVTANMPADRDGKIALLVNMNSQSPEPNEMLTAENLANVDDATLEQITSAALAQMFTQTYAAAQTEKLAVMTPEQMLGGLEAVLAGEDKDLAALCDKYIPETVSSSTYYNNLELMGYCILSKPSSVNIYCSSFENKDKVSELISKYNSGVEEEDQITYTDYVALMMSSISTIINVISYVLIAFVSISLVVSSIMIGIITYISVLERTKEIGILRAIGASKKDVSRVFNAETMIIGFVSGALGIIVTLLLNIPINIIIEHFSDISGVSSLPVVGGIALVVISVVLTLIAGLIPSRVAAKKDPVEALRSE